MKIMSLRQAGLLFLLIVMFTGTAMTMGMIQAVFLVLIPSMAGYTLARHTS